MSGPTDRTALDSAGSDRPVIDLLRKRSSMTVAQLSEALGVTQTAVRARLARLVGSGLVDRQIVHGGRGRPHHTYRVSLEAQRQLGQNYADLAVVLWDELMRSIEDRKLRRFLFGRITERLADLYRSEIQASGWQQRLEQLGTILHDRGIETEVSSRNGEALPILALHSCPYHSLAEVDRAICALERKMFEKVLGRGLRLSQCRLDGYQSCDFEAKENLTTHSADQA